MNLIDLTNWVPCHKNTIDTHLLKNKLLSCNLLHVWKRHYSDLKQIGWFPYPYIMKNYHYYRCCKLQSTENFMIIILYHLWSYFSHDAIVTVHKFLGFYLASLQLIILKRQVILHLTLLIVHRSFVI